MSHCWDAEAYHRVSDPQFEWGRAVLARLDLRGHERVIDAGCGTGRLTRALSDRLPRGEVVALDASAQMLEQARAHIVDRQPHVRLVRAMLPALPFRDWADVVFSTATFHWVLDHPALFINVFQALRPGGRLHAQCGGFGNLAQARRPAEDIMRLPRFARFFQGWGGAWEFATAETTARRLTAAGFTAVETELEPAPVVFDDEKAYRAFVSVVVFRLHLARLPDDLRGPFLDDIVSRVATLPQGFTLDYMRLSLNARRPR